ncbi:MAG: hypothetical protein AAF663_09055 [Planctomycetota bacterium]
MADLTQEQRKEALVMAGDQELWQEFRGRFEACILGFITKDQEGEDIAYFAHSGGRITCLGLNRDQETTLRSVHTAGPNVEWSD